MLARDRTTLQRLLRVALLLLELGLLTLLGSGVVLARSYRPSPPGAAIEAVGHDPYRGIHRAQDLHRIASQATVVVTLVVAALAIAVILERRHAHRWLRVAAATTVPVVVLAASFTGLLLPWDHLAITKVTVGASYKGVLVAFRDDVRYVIASGAEIGLDTYRRWVVVHLAVLPAVLVAAGIWLARLTRRSDTELQ